MSDPLKLSHSSITKYSECGQKWHLHYQKRLRDDKGHGALLFGSALDKTQNQVLEDKRDNKLQSLSYYKDLFDKLWLFGDINNQKVNLSESNLVVYAKSDFDVDLLSEKDVSDLGFKSRETLGKFYKMLLIKRSNSEELDEREEKLYAKLNWSALKCKGHLMLETLYNEFLPKIKTVLAVQKQIDLSNGEDSVVGFIDAVIVFNESEGLGDEPYVCDLKTSSMKYEADSASNSPQLAVYKHATFDEYRTDKVAFIVCYKRMEKDTKGVCGACGHQKTTQARKCDNQVNGSRCNTEWSEETTLKAAMEIIPGTIEPHFENMVVENYDNILKGIKAGVFYKNWQSCKTNYGFCPYYNYCRTGSDQGLVNV